MYKLDFKDLFMYNVNFQDIGVLYFHPLVIFLPFLGMQKTAGLKASGFFKLICYLRFFSQATDPNDTIAAQTAAPTRSEEPVEGAGVGVGFGF